VNTSNVGVTVSYRFVYHYSNHKTATGLLHMLVICRQEKFEAVLKLTIALASHCKCLMPACCTWQPLVAAGEW